MSRSSRGQKTGFGGRQGSDHSFWWLALVVLITAIATWCWWSSQEAKKTRRIVPNQLVPVVKTNAALLHPTTNRLPTISPPAKKPVLLAPTNRVAIATQPLPPLVTNSVLRLPKDVFEAQVALSQFAISPGSIDGAAGSQTRAALMAFQEKSHLPASGELDEPTRKLLSLNAPALTNYPVTSNDLSRLQPMSKTWLGKSQQTALDYETVLELVAERGHASPNMIRRLNPAVNWSNVVAGTIISIPNADYPKPAAKAAVIVISLAKKQLEAFDPETNLLAHFPCSIAARFDKRPVGELHVATIAPNPDYTFNPEVFPESEEARQLSGKLILPPGPNNPVGTAWIGLDKPGYGMHGTPIPEQVGRTESHGCFRLANWNAEYLIKLVSIGTPVIVKP